MESMHYLVCGSFVCRLDFAGAAGAVGIASVRRVPGVRIGFCTWTAFPYLLVVRLIERSHGRSRMRSGFLMIERRDVVFRRGTMPKIDGELPQRRCVSCVWQWPTLTRRCQASGKPPNTIFGAAAAAPLHLLL